MSIIQSPTNDSRSAFPLVIVDDGFWTLDFSQVTIVPPSWIPAPHHQMLVHHHHMTVTVEEHYRQSVNVKVLASRRIGDSYGRETLLETAESKRIVQFGAARIDLSCCSAPVREAILREDVPLGRVLIEHNVLRRIEPTAFLQITPGPKLADWFGLSRPETCHGRLGVIFCDDRPAIAVLEILSPIKDPV
jgi:hypothetical protein